MTKGYRQHVGTPVSSRKVKPEDGHRQNVIPPKPTPKADSGERESAEAASLRRQRSGGKD